MRFMAETYVGRPLDLVGDVFRFTFVALGAELFFLDAERLYSRVAGAARFGLFHFGHGKVFAVPQVEDGIMADPAVVFVFVQMVGVAEKSGGQAVLGRQNILPTPWLTERHGYDPTSRCGRRRTIWSFPFRPW